MPRRNKSIRHTPFYYQSACDAKRRFVNERLAKEAAEYQMLIKSDLDLSVYKCIDCGGWHLTRQARNS